MHVTSFVGQPLDHSPRNPEATWNARAGGRHGRRACHLHARILQAGPLLSVRPLCFPPAADCGGGQGLLPCGWPCPRSCQDLSPGSVCQPGPTSCQPSCGCPPGLLSQDGLCVPPVRCRCHYQPRAMGQCFPLPSANELGALQCPPAWPLPICPRGPAWSGRRGMGNLSSLMLQGLVSHASHGIRA